MFKVIYDDELEKYMNYLWVNFEKYSENIITNNIYYRINDRITFLFNNNRIKICFSNKDNFISHYNNPIIQESVMILTKFKLKINNKYKKKYVENLVSYDKIYQAHLLSEKLPKKDNIIKRIKI